MHLSSKKFSYFYFPGTFYILPMKFIDEEKIIEIKIWMIIIVTIVIN
jgi:hypothetical protein